MDVFLIPLGADRNELYCEPRAIAPELDADTDVDGYMGRLKRYFHDVLHAAENARKARVSGTRSGSGSDTDTAHDEPEQARLFARLKRRGLTWIADAIAEQRLLWHLRHQPTATLTYPSDLPEAEADDIARRILQREADHHRWWLIIDSVLLLLSALLIILPGPNLVGYYFAFRVVAHYLSWRGARQGLDNVQWTLTPSDPLAELRTAISMAPTQRTRTLLDVASRLRLDDLPTFVERVAFRSA